MRERIPFFAVQLSYSEHLTLTCADSDHITELNSARPKQPFFFLKPTSSILLPGAGPVVRPKGVDLHFEVELALIVGKQVRDFQATDEKGAIDAIESKRIVIPLYSMGLSN